MLSKFFGLITRFNRNQDIDKRLKKEIEDYFEFRWSTNKNWFVDTGEDRQLLDQLPQEIQIQIYRNFLFQDFLKEFRSKFIFRNFRSKRSYCYYQWNDMNYEAFMIKMFDALEPWCMPKGKRIQKELEECDRIVFVMGGTYKIGFKVNDQEYFRLKFSKDIEKEKEIGA